MAGPHEAALIVSRARRMPVAMIVFPYCRLQVQAVELEDGVQARLILLEARVVTGHTDYSAFDGTSHRFGFVA